MATASLKRQGTRSGDPVAPGAEAELTIAAVERDTGIGKDTLRMWERRYGFPLPGRNSHGERLYPAGQVLKLRVVKRLLDAGFRPGRVVPMSIDDLALLAGLEGETRHDAAAAPATQAQACLGLLRAHDMEGLRRYFDLAQMQMGLSRFVTELISPLNTLIGDEWIRGQVEVFEEHAYTELVQKALRHALHGLPVGAGAARPRVLLTTLRDEPHGLGLLMAEVLLVVEGAQCTSLGVQTPLPDLLRACTAFGCDVVALGFTGCNGPNAVLNGLFELRSQLPAQTELWAGGAVAAFNRRVGDDVRVLPELGRIPVEVQRWRARSI